MDREVTVAGLDLVNSACRIHATAIAPLYELGWAASSSEVYTVRYDNILWYDNIFAKAIRPPSSLLKKDLEAHRRAMVIQQRRLRRTNGSKSHRVGFVRYPSVLGLFEQPAKTDMSPAIWNFTWQGMVPTAFSTRVRCN